MLLEGFLNERAAALRFVSVGPTVRVEIGTPKRCGGSGGIGHAHPCLQVMLTDEGPMSWNRARDEAPLLAVLTVLLSRGALGSVVIVEKPFGEILKLPTSLAPTTW